MWPRAWQPLRWQPEGAPGNDETTIANISVQKKWIWFNDTWWYMYKFILYHFECTYEYIYAYIHAVYCVSIYIYIDFYIPYAGPILLNYTGYIQLSYVDTSWYINTCLLALVTTHQLMIMDVWWFVLATTNLNILNSWMVLDVKGKSVRRKMGACEVQQPTTTTNFQLEVDFMVCSFHAESLTVCGMSSKTIVFLPETINYVCVWL